MCRLRLVALLLVTCVSCRSAELTEQEYSMHSEVFPNVLETGQIEVRSGHLIKRGKWRGRGGGGSIATVREFGGDGREAGMRVWNGPRFLRIWWMKDGLPAAAEEVVVDKRNGKGRYTTGPGAVEPASAMIEVDKEGGAVISDGEVSSLDAKSFALRSRPMTLDEESRLSLRITKALEYARSLKSGHSVPR